MDLARSARVLVSQRRFRASTVTSLGPTDSNGLATFVRRAPYLLHSYPGFPQDASCPKLSTFGLIDA